MSRLMGWPAVVGHACGRACSGYRVTAAIRLVVCAHQHGRYLERLAAEETLRLVGYGRYLERLAAEETLRLRLRLVGERAP
jgi:hypothetical protein